MKNLWIYLTLATMVMFAGCTKDWIDSPLPHQNDGQKVTISVGLPLDDGTRVSLDAQTLKLTWDSGDELLAVGMKDGMIANVVTMTQNNYDAERNTASFTGVLDASLSYMFYYNTPQLIAEIGRPAVAMNYEGQTLAKSGDTSSLRDYLFIHSALLSPEELKNSAMGAIMLQPQSSVLELTLASTPEGLGRITSLEWANNLATADACVTALAYTGSEPLTKGYLSFDPAKMELKANQKISFTVYGSKKIYNVAATSTKGKQYLAGKLYRATVSTEENPLHIHLWTEVAPVIPNNEIWVKTTNGNQDTPKIRVGLGSSVVYSDVQKDDAVGYWRIKRSDGQDIVDMELSHMFASSNITEVVLPPILKVLSISAFSQCYSLAKVWLPDGVETIGGSCFAECNALECIELPSQLTSFGQQVFLNCQNLSTVVFKGSKLTEILQVFSNCPQLRSIVIPEGVERLESTFFRSGLEQVTLPSTLKVIGGNTFLANRLQTIDIPDAVEEIGRSAFSECSQLEAVNISENSQLTTFGDRVLAGSAVGSFYFPQGVTAIPEYFFQGNSSLRTITFAPDCKITTIPSNFAESTGLTSITIPQSVKEIHGGAFAYCKSLSGVEFAPNSQLSLIGERAFTRCENLWKPITFPKSLLSIGNFAFSYTDLNEINFEAGSQLQTIGDYAFEAIYSFTKFDCPNTVTSIGVGAFSSTKLEEFHFPENDQYKTIASETFRYSYLTTVHLPKNIEEIGANALANNGRLPMSVTCAEDSRLRIIRSGAFYNSIVQNLTLPRSLETVENDAFLQCFYFNFPGTVTILAPSTATIPPMGGKKMMLVLDRSWESTVDMSRGTWQGEQWGSISFID